MSSANEELPQMGKPRTSPLDFRNTDLVSRLLAATPPYLYNMPMVPNSYFFSEMLRSFVQAKSDNRSAPNIGQRRSRKRSWTQVRTEKESPKMEKTEMPSPTGWVNGIKDKPTYYDHKPLELEGSGKFGGGSGGDELQGKMLPPPTTLPERKSPNQLQMGFGNNLPTELNQNLILPPPPPPMWYPSLYPNNPYAIDPLHFFIDLRVSGHIYDRKGKESATSPIPNSNTPEQQIPLTQPEPEEKIIEVDSTDTGFKQSRHASAFSVPTPSARNGPINLSSTPDPKEIRSLKFDVKSMGFERDSNKTSTNYVLKNITRIYRDLASTSHGSLPYPNTPSLYKEEPCDPKIEDSNNTSSSPSATLTSRSNEEEEQKRVKDLRALIGMELVADYMGKPSRSNHLSEDERSRSGNELLETEESEEEEESIRSSPALEVVAIQEEL